MGPKPPHLASMPTSQQQAEPVAPRTVVLPSSGLQRYNLRKDLKTTGFPDVQLLQRLRRIAPFVRIFVLKQFNVFFTSFRSNCMLSLSIFLHNPGLKSDSRLSFHCHLFKWCSLQLIYCSLTWSLIVKLDFKTNCKPERSLYAFTLGRSTRFVN